MDKKIIDIAILGLGTVGSGVVGILKENEDKISYNIKKNTGKDVKINIKKILVRDYSKKDIFEDGILTTNFSDIEDDKDIKIVVELIGGDTLATDFIVRSLKSQKHVVTANKLAIAKSNGNLEKIANDENVNFCFEGSVGGTIPIIRVINESLEANNILEINGIVNGTTNFILSSMTKYGKSYEDALKEAQYLGYAESNPNSDVDGYDSVYKMSILSSLIFDEYPKETNIIREGISNITTEDINNAKKAGKVIKLLGKTYKRNDEIFVEVRPIFLDNNDPLASINGAENAIMIKCDNAGVIVLRGQGAGSRPTASAVVSDIINIIRKII